MTAEGSKLGRDVAREGGKGSCGDGKVMGVIVGVSGGRGFRGRGGGRRIHLHRIRVRGRGDWRGGCGCGCGCGGIVRGGVT